MNKLLNRNANTGDTVNISAQGMILGRLATRVANILRGKDSVYFQPHLLSGRRVVITHADKIVVTGKKLSQKMFYRHSGYLGHLRSATLRDELQTHPAEVIRHAVSGMLPNNRLRQHWLANLTIKDGE